MRAQTSLPALGVAFLLLTTGLVVGILAADATLRSADRDALEYRAAVGLSENLVRADAPVTERANVLNASRLSSLNPTDLRRRYGLPDDSAVRLALDDRTLVSTGTPSGGVTFERIVLVERRETRTVVPTFEGSRTVTLPRRSRVANLSLRPPANTTLRTVRVDGRIRLRDTSGLNGTYDLSLSPTETAHFRFETVGPLDADSVRIRYYPSRTEKARLGVTVDG